jgi:hypothetical protein
MLIDFYGLALETPRVTFYLGSPWRATALEHRLFEAVGQAVATKAEQGPEGLLLHVAEVKLWRAALQAVSRVLKGWQEEADPGGERRGWRWLIEGDTDPYGYDHTGEPACLWAFLRVSVDRAGPGEADKGEDVELEGFSLRVWPTVKGGRSSS